MNEEIKNITNSYTNSIEEMWNEYVIFIESVKKVCNDTPIQIQKKTNDDSIIFQTKENKYKLCDIYQETLEWGEWSVKVSETIINIPIKTCVIICKALGESLSFVLEIINKGTEYITNWLVEKLNNITIKNKWIKKIIKKIKLITLYIKKALLYAEMYSLILIKKILVFAANNKVTSALQTAYSTVISFIQSNTKIIDMTLQIIENLVSSIAGFTLDGGIMGFFTTPKSITSGIINPSPALSMTPLNVNGDIFSNISDTIINPIIEAKRNISLETKKSETSAIIANINSNAISISSTDEIIDLPDININLSNSFDLSILNAAIYTALSTLVSPEALPKYERLDAGNIGYLIWLISSFEPTMKKCFGLPGYP